MQATDTQRQKSQGTSRMVTKIDRVTDLVGAHPDTLASLFENAPPTDPEELGTTPRGLLLSLPAVSPVHLALRPLVLGLSRGGSIVWQGIEFDHGGNSGKNAVFGRGALRFRAERGSSFLDSMPALVLTYDKAPWPFSKLRDELRTIGTGIALGATFAGDKLVAWFGLTAG